MKALRIIILAIAIVALSMNSCKKDETDNNSNNTSGPNSEHSSNDGIKDNENGTYTVTLGGESFITKARDFSNQTIVTDPKSVSALKNGEYALSVGIEGFSVQNENIIAGHDSKILVYNMTSKSITDDYSVANQITGIDVNGAIITTEGSELVNFYNIKNGKISN